MKQFIKLTLIKQKEKPSSFNVYEKLKEYEIQYYPVIIRADLILYILSEENPFLGSGEHTYIHLNPVDTKNHKVLVCVKESVEEIYEMLEKIKGDEYV